MRSHGIIVAVCLLLATGSVAAQKGGGLSQDDIRKIGDASQSYTKAVLARDWKSVAALYSDQAVFYPPDEASVKGRASIEACLSAFPKLTDFALRTTKVEGRNDIAYVQGTYVMTIPSGDKSAPVQASGYFLEVRRKQADGRWLIAVHMLHPH